ncbi:aspartyl/glutamyl-tRNA(Asn/Gln) amidotransferase subunit C [Halorubrum aquaticum]|uniref:Aspartyl/glutamyl-tRNA(Asn/Gln) amidotransferase subunit C n=1 Tax=Halorubrum aquaticum TaxID=387340 RepID=A0A1I2Z7T3_9EURY|nr:Asp-tRNA(Asn)/Glu-tRNA(Gln) amidotransferase subunit GatC [Halorubrum aquaticum]SFH33923.1 aspartyl/glutamyl-tRNA(Asn/Gln) amidotransferase subunit C [Halorubrum aquaticum]
MTDTSDPDGESAGPDAGDADGDTKAGSGEPVVDAAEVEHVAELARVRLAEEETETFADQFAEILEYFEALDEVPDLDREEELVNVMRADEVEAGLAQEEALANAAETEDGFFKGPKVS